MAQADPPIDNILDRARSRFLASLNVLNPAYEVKFTPCESGNELLQHVNKLPAIRKLRLGASRKMSGLGTFVQRLESYFQAVDVIVNVNPLHASTVWGGIRFVLTLAVQYATFINNLMSAFEVLGSVFPGYDCLRNLVKDRIRSEAPTEATRVLQSSLENVYVDLLEFLYSIIRLFFKEDGSARRKFLIFSRMVWSPFEMTFGDTLKKLKHHQCVVEFALHLITFEHINETEKKVHTDQVNPQMEDFIKSKADDDSRRLQEVIDSAAAGDRRRTNVDRIRIWIDPSDFDSSLIRNHNLRTEGTTLWFLDDPIYNEWKHSTCLGDEVVTGNPNTFRSNVLWIIGNPGYGKTVLACSVIEDNLAERHTSGHAQTVCYFLFESGRIGSNTKTSAYRAFLGQILQRHQDIDSVLDCFTFVRDCTSRGQQRATDDEMLDLLRFICRLVDNVVFVLDGIDECEDQKELITDMLSVSSIPSTRSMFFSRPNVPDLLRRVPLHRRFHLDGRTVDDVQTYTQMKMAELDESALFPEGIDSSVLSPRLARRAAGMFLWITLMVSFLSSPCLTTFERLEAIEETNLPEGLDEMYDKILRLISKGSSRSKMLCQRIFTWIIHGYRPLDIRELEVALLVCAKTNHEANCRMDSYRNLTDTIIITCAGLVQVYDGQLRLCHPSLREHLLSNVALSNPNSYDGNGRTDYFRLLPSKEDAHLKMALASVKCLALRGPDKPLSEELGADFRMEDLGIRLPFLTYASNYWILHAADGVTLLGLKVEGQQLASLNELFVAILSFLSKRLAITAWVESCYWLGITPWVRCLQALGSQLQDHRMNIASSPVIVHDLGRDVTQLSHDLDLLHREWGPQLLAAPGLIWEEVTAYTPSRFLQKISTMEVKYLNLDKTNDSGLSSCYLKEISLTVDAMRYVAKLTIWPSREFEMAHRRRIDKPADLIHLFSGCRGWIAQYSVYTVENASLVVKFRLPLPAKSVFSQIEQSLWLRRNQWTVQFPLSVSADGMYFTILGTIYHIVIEGSDTPQVQSSTLPVHGRALEERQKSEQRFQEFEASNFTDNRPLVKRSHRQTCHNTYTYWTGISSDGSFVYIADRSCGQRNSIQIFARIFEEGNEVKYSAVAGREMWLSVPDPADTFCARAAWDDRKTFQLAFHPTDASLIVTHRSYREDEMFIWDIYRNECLAAGVFTRGNVQKINFSACGGYALLELKAGKCTVVPLRASGSFQLTESPSNYRHEDETCSQLAEPASDLDLLRSSGDEPRIRTPSFDPQIDPNMLPEPPSPLKFRSSVATAQGGSSSHAVVEASCAGSRVRLASRSGLDILVSRLPLTEQNEHRQVDVILPKDVGEPLKAILLQGARPWSSIRDSNDQSSTMIIYRDVDSLTPVDDNAKDGAISVGPMAEGDSQALLKL